LTNLCQILSRSGAVSPTGRRFLASGPSELASQRSSSFAACAGAASKSPTVGASPVGNISG
jgi:hypothetical protein